MKFSQPRPCGAPGAKPTHDFLSLYSTAHQDPTPSVTGDYLKTHDFLQPLEQVGKDVYKEGNYIDKSTPPSMVEHILPSFSHMNKTQSQKVAKPEGIIISAAQSSSSNTNDEYSNCTSYRGTDIGFMIWEDSKGKIRKENIARPSHTARDGVMKNGVTWMTSSQSSSINNNASTAFSSLSTSHPSSSNKNRYFADMVKFSKSVQEDEDIDEEFIIKKEPSFHHKGSVSVKVDTANPDRKSNSPRSKHSATEQRRRTKINDRFSKLRGIIPHGDQKRDKASFLLEVIEYIQFLQEKVHNYEDSSHRWTQKTVPLNNRQPDIFVDEPGHPVRQNLLDSTKETSQPTKEPSPIPDTGRLGQPALSHSRSCKTDCTIASEKLKDQELVIESGTISISTIYSQGLTSAITEALTRSGLDLSHANISVQIDLGKRSNTSTLDSSLNNDLKVLSTLITLMNLCKLLNLLISLVLCLQKEKETPSVDQSVAHSRLANTWEEESGKGLKRLKTNIN
ncbi:transcription factor BIM1-like [Bidens hawaiensis]|uniref:transcription factor BIM1-like n=1 Tax=Bidens hawaiensis TaxID=980011 RepID=UPI00404B13EC